MRPVRLWTPEARTHPTNEPLQRWCVVKCSQLPCGWSRCLQPTRNAALFLTAKLKICASKWECEQITLKPEFPIYPNYLWWSRLLRARMKNEVTNTNTIYTSSKQHWYRNTSKIRPSIGLKKVLAMKSTANSRPSLRISSLSSSSSISSIASRKPGCETVFCLSVGYRCLLKMWCSYWISRG